MTTDGLINPTFARSQIVDLSAYEVRFRRFLDPIPTDGSTRGSQPLFACLALDASTVFLFGQSIESLSPESTLDAISFLDSYN